MKSIAQWTATLGIAASLVGIVGVAPSFADDWRHGNQYVRRDTSDIRRDEQCLRDLEHRRDQEARRHDWRDVRSLDVQIADLRLHIEQDRRDVRGDYRDNRYNNDYRRNNGNDRYHSNRNNRNYDNQDNRNYDNQGNSSWRHGEGR